MNNRNRVFSGNVEVWFSSELSPGDGVWFQGPQDVTYAVGRTAGTVSFVKDYKSKG